MAETDVKRTDRAAKEEQHACERYGRFGAFQFGDIWLCPACYQERGSCCPEFGADDLWPTEEEQSEKQKHGK